MDESRNNRSETSLAIMVKETRLINQNNKNKKRKYKPKVTYKYGIKVPRNIAECKKLDDENGNTFGWTRLCRR